MLNKQIPLKQVHFGDADTSKVLVHSIFPTIQGEGIFSGYPCVFVRLGGCNLQCPECDTEYSEGATYMDIFDLREKVLALMPKGASLIVVTGGEPFRQPIGDMIGALLANNELSLQIETNGTLFDPTVWYDHPRLFIVCSPKAGKVNKHLQPHIDAYKYVGGGNEFEVKEFEGNKSIQDHRLLEDGLPLRALGHSAYPHLARPHEGFKGKVFLQPIDRQDEEINKFHLNTVVQSCLNNGYILCLQTHKIIDVA